MAIVAFVGIIINSLLLFFYERQRCRFKRERCLFHMAADALVSLGVVIAGVVIILPIGFG
jgi:cobalt-zinc-cadmium efflux system protein